MEIKPIETQYKGYLFRSRLEARHAVMFDSLKWKWEYEPEGFDLLDEYYLPDFLITTDTNDQYWVEVKPDTDWGMEEGDRILKKFVILKMEPALLMYGTPFVQMVKYDYAEKDEIFEEDWVVRTVIRMKGPSAERAIKAARSARFEYRR